MSLLKKAKSIENKKPRHKKMYLTDELIELAIAWAKDEVTLTQCAKVIFPDKETSKSTNLVYSRFAIVLKEAIRQGKLK